jgi:hypothetical protein
MGRVVGWCVAGLVGVAIGWFSRGAFPAARPEPEAGPAAADAAGTAPVPELAAGTMPALAPAPVPAASNESSPSAPKRSSTVRRSVDEILVDFRAAIAETDTSRFKNAVRELGEADDPRGDAALVELMADLSTPLPVVGEELQKALTNSRADGIAAAARARLESAIERNESAWHHYQGWVDLVAAHGTEADLEWLASDAFKSQEGWALPAIARTGHPTAAKILARRIESGGAEETTRAVGEFAKLRPDLAWPLVLLHPSREALSSYAKSAPLENLGPVEEHLRSLPDDEARIEAVYVVSALERRGLDVSEFATLTQAPVRFLARIAAGEPVTPRTRPLLNAAGYAIEYNSLTWTEDAARTLDAADAALDSAGITVGGPDYPYVARLVRDGIKKRWN